ncbi:MAG: hypothetical protein RL685_3953 [Pseudomonadota bacterium]|jgi:hypothetical protein
MNLRGGTLTQKRGTTYDMSVGSQPLGFVGSALAAGHLGPDRQQTINWLEPSEP